MTDKSDATLSDDRVRALLAAYGADPDRWPAHERDAAQRRIAASPELASEVADAAALDSFLDALPTPVPSPALRAALKDIPDQAAQSWADWHAGLWPFGAPWRPAAGLVAAAVVGIMVGIASPSTDTVTTETTSVAAYDPVADVAALASGAGTLESLQ